MNPTDKQSPAVSVDAVRTDAGTTVTDPDTPTSVESYDQITFTLSDGRTVSIECGETIVDANGNMSYVGRVHAIRHLGGTDGWGYAVYLERPAQNGCEFGRSEGVQLHHVAAWFQTGSRTTQR